MNIFDTHAHLLDEQFDADREQLLVSLPEQGITHVMEACCDEAGIDRVIELVARTPYFYGSAGVHPHSADEWKPETADHIRAALGHERMVAIGEIGLDYHYDFSPRETQRDCFDAQLALAAELRRPVIIHDREAHGDTMDLLRHYRGRLSGVMHCFSASYEIAKECIDLGLYIAFGGALTFKNAVNQWTIAAKLPLDRLLIETDCPYMTPVPFRGKRNDPSLIVYTLDKLSELRGADREALAEILYDNSFRAFGIRRIDRRGGDLRAADLVLRIDDLVDRLLGADRLDKRAVHVLVDIGLDLVSVVRIADQYRFRARKHRLVDLVFVLGLVVCGRMLQDLVAAAVFDARLLHAVDLDIDVLSPAAFRILRDVHEHVDRVAGVVLEPEIDVVVLVVHGRVEAETVLKVFGHVVRRDAVPSAVDVRDACAQDRVEHRRADLAHAAAGFLAVAAALIDRVRRHPAILFGAVAGLLVEAERFAGGERHDLHHVDRFRNVRVARHAVLSNVRIGRGRALKAVVGRIAAEQVILRLQHFDRDLRLGDGDRRRQIRGIVARVQRVGDLALERVGVDARAVRAGRELPVRLIVFHVVDLVGLELDLRRRVDRVARDLLVQRLQRGAQGLGVERRCKLQRLRCVALRGEQQGVLKGFREVEPDVVGMQRDIVLLIGDHDRDGISGARDRIVQLSARFGDRQVLHLHAVDRHVRSDHRLVKRRRRRRLAGLRRVGHGWRFALAALASAAGEVVQKQDRADQHKHREQQERARKQQPALFLFADSAFALLRRLIRSAGGRCALCAGGAVRRGGAGRGSGARRGGAAAGCCLRGRFAFDGSAFAGKAQRAVRRLEGVLGAAVGLHGKRLSLRIGTCESGGFRIDLRAYCARRDCRCHDFVL